MQGQSASLRSYVVTQVDCRLQFHKDNLEQVTPIRKYVSKHFAFVLKVLLKVLPKVLSL